MSGTTTNFAFPYPSESDTPDGAAQIQSLATAVDTNLHARDVGSKVPTIFSSSGTLASTVYPLARALVIECWGGGGASGAAVATIVNTSSGGGGGKGGSYAKKTVAIGSLVFPLAVTVGAGGTGGAGAGGNGAASTVVNGATTYCSAAGGNGGTALTQSGTVGYGSGGIAVTGSDVGDFTADGTDGCVAFRWSTTGVLGGPGGAAAGGGGGGGTAGTGFGGAGAAGHAPGGGGGGPNQANAAGATVNGSSGAIGFVVISPLY